MRGWEISWDITHLFLNRRNSKTCNLVHIYWASVSTTYLGTLAIEYKRTFNTTFTISTLTPISSSTQQKHQHSKS